MIRIKSPQEIALIRNSCKILVNTVQLLGKLIREGVTTEEIDGEAEQFIRSRGARPAFKGYNGFPATTCISINDQVVHGIPDDTKLQNGMLVSIDIGVELNGYFGDAAKTFIVGDVEPEKKRLVEVTRQALYKGIEIIQPGRRLSDISHAIQSHVESAGYSVVRDLVGHGIGKKLHEDPQIPNYGPPHQGPKLKEGMVFAIEPMVNQGGYQVIIDDDQWTVRTKDGLPSAHFEHTVAIAANGPDILTSGI